MLHGMCRSIKTLRIGPVPASDDEITAAALQYVRKVGGSTKPARANEEAYAVAVAKVAAATQELLDSLVTTAPPKDREAEATKARARAQARYA